MDWNLWALDKSVKVGTLRVKVKDEAKGDLKLEKAMRADLQQRCKKYVADLTI